MASRITHHAQQTLRLRLRITLSTKHSFVRFTPPLFRLNTLTIPPLFSRSVFPDSQEWTSQRNRTSGALSKQLLYTANVRLAILFHKNRSAYDTMFTNSQEPRVGTVTRGKREWVLRLPAEGKDLFLFLNYPDQLRGTPSLPLNEYLETLSPG